MDNKAFENDVDLENKNNFKMVTNVKNDILKLFDKLNNHEFSFHNVKNFEKGSLRSQNSVSTSSLLTDSDSSEFKIDDDSLAIEPVLKDEGFLEINTTYSSDDDISLLKRCEYTYQEIFCKLEVKQMDMAYLKIFRNEQKNKYETCFFFSTSSCLSNL